MAHVKYNVWICTQSTISSALSGQEWGGRGKYVCGGASKGHEDDY